MIKNDYEESSIKEIYIKLASLIEVKSIFKGSFPITLKDIDEAIQLFEKMQTDAKK